MVSRDFYKLQMYLQIILKGVFWEENVDISEWLTICIYKACDIYRFVI